MPTAPRPVRPDPHADPIGPFLHYLMAECGLSAHTLAAYRSDIARFSRWRKQFAPGPLAQLQSAISSASSTTWSASAWPRPASGATSRPSRLSTAT